MPDLGIQVINALARALNIDRRWLQTIERGFRWWPGLLAQSAWADPCFEEKGLSIARIHIRTDLLADVPSTEVTLPRLGVLMRYAGLSGLLSDRGQPGRYRLAASIYVHEQTRPWLTRLAILVASCQAAEAHIMADGLASTVGGSVDSTYHPTAGPPTSLHPVTCYLERAVAPDGQHPSRFRGDEMLAALEMLEGTPFQANGDEEGLACEFPFGPETSLLVADAAEVNPRVGAGLLMRLTLPVGAASAGDAKAAQASMELNRRELTELTRAHFLGSWCPTEEGLCFVSFFPNAVAAFSPGCVRTLVQGATCRARWAAGVFGRSFEPDRAAAGQAEMLERLRHLPEEDLREIAANLPPGQDPQRFLQFMLAMKQAMEADEGE